MFAFVCSVLFMIWIIMDDSAEQPAPYCHFLRLNDRAAYDDYGDDDDADDADDFAAWFIVRVYTYYR